MGPNGPAMCQSYPKWKDQSGQYIHNLYITRVFSLIFIFEYCLLLTQRQLNDTSAEYQFAKQAVFGRHPQLENMPAGDIAFFQVS